MPVWALVSLAWIGPAFLAASKEFLQGQLPGRDPAPPRVVLFEFGDWLLLALLTPLIFWFARRFPLTRGTLSRRIPVEAQQRDFDETPQQLDLPVERG